jgi:hypothetical protein
VRPDRVVFQPPSLNQHLDFFQGIEDLPVELFTVGAFR